MDQKLSAAQRCPNVPRGGPSWFKAAQGHFKHSAAQSRLEMLQDAGLLHAKSTEGSLAACGPKIWLLRVNCMKIAQKSSHYPHYRVVHACSTLLQSCGTSMRQWAIDVTHNPVHLAYEKRLKAAFRRIKFCLCHTGA